MSNSTSAFKLIYSHMLKSGKVPDKLKKPIKCYVKETNPYFLVTDDHFYVPCYFTKKAVDSFNKRLSDMQGKVLTFSDWSLEMCKVKSDQVFTSYAGIEVRFVVNSVSVTNSSSDSIELNRQPSNLYRDAEIKALINKVVYDAQVKSVSGAGLPDIAKMSGKGNVGASIVKCGDAKLGFKTPTAIVSVTSGKASAKAKSIKPTVKGGKTAKVAAKKTISKGKGSISSKILKATPSGKKSKVGKASVMKDHSGAGTTDARSMKQFKKLVAKHQKGRK